MPKDDKFEKIDGDQENLSFGRDTPKDKKKLSPKEGDSFVDKAKGAYGNLKKSGGSYSARRNNDNDLSRKGRNYSGGDNSKESYDNDSRKNNIKKQATKNMVNVSKAVPGVGQVVQGAALANDVVNRIKDRRNNSNINGNRNNSSQGDNKNKDKEKNKKNDKNKDSVDKNKDSVDKNKDKKKKNSILEKEDKNEEVNDNGDLSNSNGKGDVTESLNGSKFFKKFRLLLIGLVVALFALIAFVLLPLIVASFSLEFVSSMIRGEELLDFLDISSEVTSEEGQEDFKNELEKVSKENSKVNPDFIASTLAVMMDNGQYAEKGIYGYADFIPRHFEFQVFGVRVKSLDNSNIKKLAEIFAKQPLVNTSSTTTSSAGTGEVAGDAGTMVGTGHGLGESYVPNVIDTGRMGVDGEVCHVTQETYDAFQKMEQGAAAQGVTIGVNSCYRSYAEQAGTTGNSPASAGYSEHQLGSTIDIADRDGGYITNETVLAWLNDHAFEYGFVRSLADMGDERHHYRYVGTKVAAAYKNYLDNGGLNYLAFQGSEGQSVIGSSTTSSSSSSSTSGSSGSAAKVVEIALAEEGQAEQAGGVTKYGQWYGEGMASAEWCGIFVSWVANHAGVGEDIIPKSGLPAFYKQWFEEKGLYHSLASEPNYTPKPGDLAIYDRGHIGIVVEYNNGRIKTIDGNSGINTDRVAIKEGAIGEYPLDISGFASPNYSNSSTSVESNSASGSDIKFTDEVREDLKKFLRERLTRIDELEDEETSDGILNSLVDQIENRTKNFYDYIGKKMLDCSTSTGSGNCDYNIKGFYYSGANHDQQLSISNLKVRLMDCSSNPSPIEGEELVDFEKYILGVVYAEIGEGAPAEAMKAQAIAARSYALSRPASMGNSGGTLLAQENGQWILQLRACTMDQVYCDPDRGCAKTGGENSLTKSGTDWGGNLYKNPLPSDDPLRSAVEETKGKLLVNNEGYVINSGYLNTDQNQWSSMASSGKNYTDILIEHYNNSRNYGAKSIESMSCTGGSTSSSNNPLCATQTALNAASGPYADWKQCDERWGGNSLGDSTICGIGCLATSMSMLIAKSGVPTNVSGEFNPGSFVEAMKSAGGFTGGGDYNWSVTPSVVPSYQDSEFLDYFPSDVAAKTNQGYFAVVYVGKVGRDCHHWVAVDRVENGVVYILDPAGDNGPIDTIYPNKCGVHYFKLK